MSKYILIHAIAQCSDCDWTEEHYLKAQNEARKHYLKTGHQIIVETGSTFTYERKIKRKV